MARKRPADNFETSLQSLERIVSEMESGDLPLERSLELFEQGVRLSRECQERLNEAERRIEFLLRDAHGRPVLERVAVAEDAGEPDEVDADTDDDDDDF